MTVEAVAESLDAGALRAMLEEAAPFSTADMPSPYRDLFERWGGNGACFVDGWLVCAPYVWDDQGRNRCIGIDDEVFPESEWQDGTWPLIQALAIALRLQEDPDWVGSVAGP